MSDTEQPLMTSDEMIAFTRAIVETHGKTVMSVKGGKDELVRFAKSLLAEPEVQAAAAVAPEVPAPVLEQPRRVERTEARPHKSPVRVERTDTGAIHIGRDANRYYRDVEALALAEKIRRVASGEALTE